MDPFQAALQGLQSSGGGGGGGRGGGRGGGGQQGRPPKSTANPGGGRGGGGAWQQQSAGGGHKRGSRDDAPPPPPPAAGSGGFGSLKRRREEEGGPSQKQGSTNSRASPAPAPPPEQQQQPGPHASGPRLPSNSSSPRWKPYEGPLGPHLGFNYWLSNDSQTGQVLTGDIRDLVVAVLTGGGGGSSVDTAASDATAAVLAALTGDGERSAEQQPPPSPRAAAIPAWVRADSLRGVRRVVLACAAGLDVRAAESEIHSGRAPFLRACTSVPTRHALAHSLRAVPAAALPAPALLLWSEHARLPPRRLRGARVRDVFGGDHVLAFELARERGARCYRDTVFFHYEPAPPDTTPPPPTPAVTAATAAVTADAEEAPSESVSTASGGAAAAEAELAAATEGAVAAAHAEEVVAQGWCRRAGTNFRGQWVLVVEGCAQQQQQQSERHHRWMLRLTWSGAAAETDTLVLRCPEPPADGTATGTAAHHSEPVLGDAGELVFVTAPPEPPPPAASDGNGGSDGEVEGATAAGDAGRRGGGVRLAHQDVSTVVLTLQGHMPMPTLEDPPPDPPITIRATAPGADDVTAGHPPPPPGCAVVEAPLSRLDAADFALTKAERYAMDIPVHVAEESKGYVASGTAAAPVTATAATAVAPAGAVTKGRKGGGGGDAMDVVEEGEEGEEEDGEVAPATAGGPAGGGNSSSSSSSDSEDGEVAAATTAASAAAGGKRKQPAGDGLPPFAAPPAAALLPSGGVTADGRARARGYKLLGLDCEMVYTKAGLEVARVTLVDARGGTVYDRHVRPPRPVTDHNTRYSGVDAAALAGVTRTLADVQRDLGPLLDARTYLVGHSLESDLRALKLVHPALIDTAALYPSPKGAPFKQGLRRLCAALLGRDVQPGTGTSGHDSAVDAAAAMELALLKMLRGPDFGLPRAWGNEPIPPREHLFTTLSRALTATGGTEGASQGVLSAAVVGDYCGRASADFPADARLWTRFGLGYRREADAAWVALQLGGGDSGGAAGDDGLPASDGGRFTLARACADSSGSGGGDGKGEVRVHVTGNCAGAADMLAAAEAALPPATAVSEGGGAPAAKRHKGSRGGSGSARGADGSAPPPPDLLWVDLPCDPFAGDGSDDPAGGGGGGGGSDSSGDSDDSGDGDGSGAPANAGSGRRQWRGLRDVDAAARRLYSRAPPGTLLVVVCQASAARLRRAMSTKMRSRWSARDAESNNAIEGANKATAWEDGDEKALGAQADLVLNGMTFLAVKR